MSTIHTFVLHVPCQLRYEAACHAVRTFHSGVNNCPCTWHQSQWQFDWQSEISLGVNQYKLVRAHGHDWFRSLVGKGVDSARVRKLFTFWRSCQRNVQVQTCLWNVQSLTGHIQPYLASSQKHYTLWTVYTSCTVNAIHQWRNRPQCMSSGHRASLWTFR